MHARQVPLTSEQARLLDRAIIRAPSDAAEEASAALRGREAGLLRLRRRHELARRCLGLARDGAHGAELVCVVPVDGAQGHEPTAAEGQAVDALEQVERERADHPLPEDGPVEEEDEKEEEEEMVAQPEGFVLRPAHRLRRAGADEDEDAHEHVACESVEGLPPIRHHLRVPRMPEPSAEVDVGQGVVGVVAGGVAEGGEAHAVLGDADVGLDAQVQRQDARDEGPGPVGQAR
mmetsp:Transcript_3768/g.10617  ORF Transcript_3768/g.10617 Transcript_3768/m.10617 type:complete len:233 (-) Transcript_3768:357-1055(-)